MRMVFVRAVAKRYKEVNVVRACRPAVRSYCEINSWQSSSSSSPSQIETASRRRFTVVVVYYWRYISALVLFAELDIEICTPRSPIQKNSIRAFPKVILLQWECEKTPLVTVNVKSRYLIEWAILRRNSYLFCCGVSILINNTTWGLVRKRARSLQWLLLILK